MAIGTSGVIEVEHGLPATENPLDKTKVEDIDEKIYEDKDRDYLSYLQKRLESARDQRNQLYPEFNDSTYLDYFEENEDVANTKLPKKINDDDVIVSAGTIEQKLDALLANINNLNLTPEAHIFDKFNNKLDKISTAIDDVLFETAKNDGGTEGGDDEKKIMRQRELLKQGTVFVQDRWLKKFEIKKKLKGKYNGQFKDVEWSKNLEKVFEGPSRDILYGPNVYLGNITEFFMENQPFVFVIKHKTYSDARRIYGNFDNWKYVIPGNVDNIEASEQKTIYDNKWRLEDVQKDQVEIIIYQDQPSDEFQVLINGVAMFPIGFPLSAISPEGKYNIVKQVYRIINSQFAYGGSFVSSGSVKQVSKLLDEMLKLAVLKTRKSYAPPYANMSNKVISKKVLSAGRISMGIQPDSLVAIGNEGTGVNSSEYRIIEMLQDVIDKSTVSDTFTGQESKSGTTATEILQLQKQAKLTLGLTVTVCSFLEQKLGMIRVNLIFKHWFEPTGTSIIGINEGRQVLNTYRKTTRSTNISRQGKGERQTIITDQKLPNGDLIREMELEDQIRRGIPIQKIFISRDGLKNIKKYFYITVNTKEKNTSTREKLEFSEKLNGLLSLMQLGSIPNMNELEDEFARVWNMSKDKLFTDRGQGGSAPIGGQSGVNTPVKVQGRTKPVNGGVQGLPAEALQ